MWSDDFTTLYLALTPEHDPKGRVPWMLIFIMLVALLAAILDGFVKAP